jgi:hypothetical protein
LYGLSGIHIGENIHYIFYPLINGIELVNIEYWVQIIVFLCIDLLLGMGSCVYMLFAKEPSGEYAGSSKKRYRWIKYLYYVTFAMISYLAIDYFYLHSMIYRLFIAIVIFYVGYYLAISVSNRSFKPTKQDYIAFLINAILIVGFIVLKTLLYYKLGY